MRTTFAAVFATALLANCAAVAASASAEDVALRQAKKRGYTAAQTSCYVGVFKSYARPSPRGGWIVRGGKTGNVYRNELFSKCGVSR